eukprot:9021635-Lingulodinium_polyedra.AAC.1
MSGHLFTSSLRRGARRGGASASRPRTCERWKLTSDQKNCTQHWKTALDVTDNLRSWTAKFNADQR